MYLYNIKNEHELRRKIYKFAIEHKHLFDDLEWKELHNFLYYGNVTVPLTDTLLAQIYEMNGIIKKSCSTYYNFSQILKYNFNLDRPVVEVGSGIFPVLGSYLSQEQRNLKNGTLTIYDSRIWTDSKVNAVLKKEMFTEKTIVPSNTLLIGTYPCEATEMMIEKALNEELEFCIALCGCNHSDNPSLNVDEYHQFLVDKIEDNMPKNYQLDVTYLPKKCFARKYEGYPILLCREQEKIKNLNLFTSILKK